MYRKITFGPSGKMILRGIASSKEGRRPIVIMHSQARCVIPIDFGPMLHDGDGIIAVGAVADGMQVAVDHDGRTINLAMINVRSTGWSDYQHRTSRELHSARVTLQVAFMSGNDKVIEILARGANIASDVWQTPTLQTRQVFRHIPFFGAEIETPIGNVPDDVARLIGNMGHHIGITADHYHASPDTFTTGASVDEVTEPQGVADEVTA